MGNVLKQVTITPSIHQKLQSAVGDGVDVSKHPVFEAVGLNTKPVRKDHPLYKGARHTKTYLKQMASAVNKESLPLQIMHDSGSLPVGRVFSGDVVDQPSGPELRVLFWVDPQVPDITAGLNSGTIDQVSVSTLAKDPVCSECGFNFLGPDADMDLIFSGKCGNGHTMGSDGPHVTMNNLDHWFEMSLVGRGGAVGARVLSPSAAMLATSGPHAPLMTLNLSTSDLEPPMDMTALLAKLESIEAKLAAGEVKTPHDKGGPAAGSGKSAADPADSDDPDTNTPAIGDLAARVADLEKKMTEVTKAPIPVTPKAKTDDDGNFLLSAFNELATAVLVMSGDVEAKIPTDAAAAVAYVKTKLTALKAAGGGATEAASGTTAVASKKPSNAYKSAR